MLTKFTPFTFETAVPESVGVDSTSLADFEAAVRESKNIENEVDSFEIFVEDDKVILKKFNPKCAFCGGISQGVTYNGYEVCLKCIDKLNELKDLAT